MKQWLWNWLIRKMPWVERVPWSSFFGAGIALLAGASLTLIGLSSSDDESMPSGRGPVVAAGLTFFLAGLALLVPAIASFFPSISGKIAHAVGTAIGILLLFAFTAVPTCITINDWGTEDFNWEPAAGSLVMFALLGLLTYVYIRDRKAKNR